MASGQRTPSFRPQLSMRREYEPLQPRSETKESPDAHILYVYLPGFPRDSVKITYIAASRMVRVTGERQVQGTRWVRFDQSYPFPDYCDPVGLQGKFETPVLTLTMPRKKTSEAAPKQVETTQEKRVVAEAKPDEKGQETIPPQPRGTTTKVEEPIEDKKSASSPPRQEKATLEDKPSQIPSEPIKPQKGKEETVERLSSEETSKPQISEKELETKPTPTRVTTMQKDEKPQKGQDEVESKSTPTMLTKIKTAEKPQKGQEEIESKSTPTMLTEVKTVEKSQKGQEEFEPRPTQTMLTKVKTAEKPQKHQEEFEPEPKPTTMAPPKIKTDEEPPKGQDEVERKHATTNVTRKPTVTEQLEEKQTGGTSAEDLEKERISKKEMKKEGKSEQNSMVCSLSQVVSKIAEGIRNEEKKKLAANVGAAVLVIATLGAYVSYRFASSGRT